MTTQEKLLLAAEAALELRAGDYLVNSGLPEIAAEINYLWGSRADDRCLYLCFLAAAWEDL